MSLSDWMLLLSPWIAFTALIMWDTRTQRTRIIVRDENTYERALVNWTRVLGISTIGLVGATIVSAYILHRTDDAIHRSLEVFQRDEQPYVELVTDRNEEPFFTLDTNNGVGRLNWNFAFKNMGKRAARNFSVKKFIKVAGREFQTGPAQGEASGYFGPNAAGWTTFSFDNLTLADFEKLMKQDAGITILVEFKYRDAIDKQHSNAFCITRFGNKSIAALNAEACQNELRR